MTWLSKSITGFGLVLLAHACYSAREQTALQTTASSVTSHNAPLGASAALPLDITIETITSIVIVCLGMVLGTPDLRPIQWRVWAGKIEREGEQGFLDSEGVVAKDYVGNPFRRLESRPGFVDIRKQKREFAEWVREGGGSTS